MRSSKSEPISSIIGFLDFIDHAAFNVVNGVSNIVQASRLFAEVSNDIEVESFVFISQLRVKTTYQVHISLIGIVKVFFVKSSGVRSLRALDHSEAIVSEPDTIVRLELSVLDVPTYMSVGSILLELRRRNFFFFLAH